jgi:hypothetical protein
MKTIYILYAERDDCPPLFLRGFYDNEKAQLELAKLHLFLKGQWKNGRLNLNGELFTYLKEAYGNDETGFDCFNVLPVELE